MTIDKNFLKKFKTINLIFSNDGNFKIPVAEITEIRCDAADTRRRSDGRFRIWDGFFKISPKGAQTFEESYDEEQRGLDAEYGGATEDDYTLKTRVSRFFDICAVDLERENGEVVGFSLPYDPLTESIYENEIEFSNCPSSEIDESGAVSVFIGNSSKMPKRVDNNYDELIDGWKKSFQNYKPDSMKAHLNALSNYEGTDNAHGLIADLTLLNKKSKDRELYLVFSDCSRYTFRVNFDDIEDCEINLSRLQNGRIFVDFVGCNFTFECKKIKIDDEAFYCLYDSELSN